jgi:hypothetical protein
MAAYEILPGQTITVDDIFYVDPTGGDDSNDGLTSETAWKKITAAGSTFKTGKNAVFVFVPGEHNIDGSTYGYLIPQSVYKNNYYVMNPRNTKVNYKGVSGKAVIYSNSDSDGLKYYIGFNVKVTETIAYLAYQKGSPTFYNCYFDIKDATVSTKTFFTAIQSGASFAASNILYCAIDAGSKTITFNSFNTQGDHRLSYCVMIAGSISPSPGASPYTVTANKCLSNIASAYTTTSSWQSGYALNEKIEPYEAATGIVSTTAGVWIGAYYPWGSFLYRSHFYLKDANGDYYRVTNGALEAVTNLSAYEGLEHYLSPDDMEVIRTLDEPVLVGYNADTIAYKSILLDDVQLLIPTGDIDLSLASAINSFVFTDTGDVRRLLSVDRGATWQYWDSDNAVFAEFEGDITDKAAVYDVANDTATLNALTADDIATIILPASVDKHIRFLTVLRQESLSADTRTLSVGIDNARRGYFKSVPLSNFEETLYTGSLQVKYIGTDGITELHLLLSV